MAITTVVTSEPEKRSLRTEGAHHYYIPASYGAFQILRFGFALLPIVAGIDKFFNYLVDWSAYLSPWATNITGLTPREFMYCVGVVEIIAGGLVALKPRIGGAVVAVWLWAIIANLLFIPSYYDIALRDFGLSLGALALSMLSVEFGTYRRTSYSVRRR